MSSLPPRRARLRPWMPDGRARHSPKNPLTSARSAPVPSGYRMTRSGELQLCLLTLGGGRAGRVRGEAPDQLGARVDVKLAIDAAEVELDRLVTQEQRGADVLVRL